MQNVFNSSYQTTGKKNKNEGRATDEHPTMTTDEHPTMTTDEHPTRASDDQPTRATDVHPTRASDDPTSPVSSTEQGRCHKKIL